MCTSARPCTKSSKIPPTEKPGTIVKLQGRLDERPKKGRPPHPDAAGFFVVLTKEQVAAPGGHRCRRPHDLTFLGPARTVFPCAQL